MRRAYVAGAVALVLTGAAGPAWAGERPPEMDEIVAELHTLRSRVEAMEHVHAADQERITELENRVTFYEQTTSEAYGDQVAATGAVPLPDAEWEATPGLPNAGGLGQGNIYNPGITAFVDAGGAFSNNGADKARNRFNLRETELDFRSAIGPTVDGVIILAFAEDVAQELDGDIDVAQALEIEEVYLNFHTLPYDLQLKTGRFRTAFGANNRLHTHDLPQVTRPLAVEAFLGPEGMISDGASVTWLVPNPWDRYVELTAEVFNSDGGEEAPILGGPNADNPAALSHLKYFQDVGATGSLELGGTYLFAHTGDEGDQNANVFGLDGMYRWLDPARPDSRSFLLQTELFWAENDLIAGFDSDENSSFGAYAFGQYQFDPNWYAGVRLDYTEFPNSDLRGPTDHDWAISPYITWYITEFLRLRFQWEHRDFGKSAVFGEDEEDTFLLQFTYAIGAHPPHPYWVNR